MVMFATLCGLVFSHCGRSTFRNVLTPTGTVQPVTPLPPTLPPNLLPP